MIAFLLLFKVSLLANRLMVMIPKLRASGACDLLLLALRCPLLPSHGKLHASCGSLNGFFVFEIHFYELLWQAMCGIPCFIMSVYIDITVL